MRLNLSDNNDSLTLHAQRLLKTSGHVVNAKMILFTEESGRYLAPPFPGGYGVMLMYDYQKVGPTIVQTGKRMKNRKTEVRPYILPDSSPYYDVPTKKNPLMIKIIGGDDSSYSLMLSSTEEAESMWNLLVEMQPLDFQKDILPFGFKFTN
jgi:hypothetical protein